MFWKLFTNAALNHRCLLWTYNDLFLWVSLIATLSCMQVAGSGWRCEVGMGMEGRTPHPPKYRRNRKFARPLAQGVTRVCPEACTTKQRPRSEKKRRLSFQRCARSPGSSCDSGTWLFSALTISCQSLGTSSQSLFTVPFGYWTPVLESRGHHLWCLRGDGIDFWPVLLVSGNQVGDPKYWKSKKLSKNLLEKNLKHITVWGPKISPKCCKKKKALES